MREGGRRAEGKREKWRNQGAGKERDIRSFEGKEKNKISLKKINWKNEGGKTERISERSEEQIGRSRKNEKWECWGRRKAYMVFLNHKRDTLSPQRSVSQRARFQERVMWLNNTPRFGLTESWHSASWAFPKTWRVVATSGFFNTPSYQLGGTAGLTCGHNHLCWGLMPRCLLWVIEGTPLGAAILFQPPVPNVGVVHAGSTQGKLGIVQSTDAFIKENCHSW